MTKRYAIIEDGLVTNVALADAEFAAEQGWLAAPDDVGPGWSYDGKTFTKPDPTPEPEHEATDVRAALRALGLTDEQIDALASAVK